MNDDSALIKAFVEDDVEAAFTELVQRHLAMVYGTALRRVGGDAHLAQDVTQTVFISLARKASSLRSHVSLVGWLYVSTHRAAAEVVRREQRRKHRETSAHSINLISMSDNPSVDAAALRPLIDDALVALKADDREAVVLRFFAQRSFSEIGVALRITEEAARKRVSRALDQLHGTLSQRGIKSTVAALATALTAAGVAAAPATLATEIAAVALAQAALVPAAAFGATLTSSLLPAGAIAAVIAGIWTILPQQRANADMASEIARLERPAGATAGMQSEIDDLTRALTHAPRSPSKVSPPPEAARAANPVPITYARSAGAKEVSVSPEGRLQWEGEPITLDEFLFRLTQHRSSATVSGAQLIVKGNGARFAQLLYVLDEARKAGITSLVVESDSDPAHSPTPMSSWF